MDWKEKGIEYGYLGALSVIGIWVVKKFKPFTKWVTKTYKLSGRIDILEKELKTTVEKLETRIAVDEIGKV